jgi:hypothetical protein
MITQKGLTWGLYAKHNRGEKLARGEAERMRKREVASVQRSTDLHNHKTEMQSDKRDKLC